MPSYKPVTAALRALDILAAVNRLNNKATVGEIHRSTGVDKATIVRMLETLMHGGYVMRDPDQVVYRITGKTLSLGSSFDRHKVVGAIISDVLTRFRMEIGWPSDVALFDHDAMLVVKSSRESEPLFLSRHPGFRAPVLGTSLGLAYTAYCADELREQIIDRVVNDPAPWNELARDRPRLDHKLAMIRAQGYATMDDHYSRAEYSGRIFSIGVPITHGASLFASINIIYLTTALTPEAAKETLLGPLKSVAETMGQELATRGADAVPVASALQGTRERRT